MQKIVFVIVHKKTRKSIFALDSREQAEKIASEDYEVIEATFREKEKRMSGSSST